MIAFDTLIKLLNFDHDNHTFSWIGLIMYNWNLYCTWKLTMLYYATEYGWPFYSGNANVQTFYHTEMVNLSWLYAPTWPHPKNHQRTITTPIWHELDYSNITRHLYLCSHVILPLFSVYIHWSVFVSDHINNIEILIRTNWKESQNVIHVHHKTACDISNDIKI